MPPAVLTNDDLPTLFDTTAGWICTRTGMRERGLFYLSAIEMASVAARRSRARGS